MNESASSYQTSGFGLLSSFFLNNIVYYIAGAAAVTFVISYFQPIVYRMAWLILLLLIITIIVDAALVYGKRRGMHAQRQTTDRFSIGDLNKVNIKLMNKYPFAARVSVIDELPE